MPSERTVRRYSAFFRGWATAFGAHEKEADEERGLIWLFGEEQVGLILTPAVKRFLYPLFLGNSHDQALTVSLGGGFLRIQDVEITIADKDRRAFDAIIELLRTDADLHFLQTYHLVYASGTRILTLTRRAPLPLVYREIAPLVAKLT